MVAKVVPWLFVVVVSLGQLGSVPRLHQEPIALVAPRFFPTMPLPTSGPVTHATVQLGRMLFHDPVLSGDSSFSCAHCHRQQFAFGDAPVRVSTGHTGVPMRRNTPPLFNLAWYPAFGWDGRSATLEDQVLHPVRTATEMGGDWTVVVPRIRRSARYVPLFDAAFPGSDIDSNLVARAIDHFLRTLISANSKYDRVLRGEDRFTEDEHAGFLIANEQDKGDCLQCHTTDSDALGTTGRFSNNGLPGGGPDDIGRAEVTGDQRDLGRFKIPSLRNVAVTAPYMHDGRFATLEEVLRFYNEGVVSGPYVDPLMGIAHRGGAHLDSIEVRQLLAFLHTLTDHAFIHDQAHANPFLTE
jgi:cytochrome c peroxidase